MPFITEQEQLARQEELRVLKEQYEFAVKAGTSQGFFELYYKMLPHCSNFQEAFNTLNDRYFDVFGTYKYSNYKSFKVTLSKSNKK